MRAIILAAMLAVAFAGCAGPLTQVDQSCQGGEFAFGIDDDGELRCGAVDWGSLDDIPGGFADGQDNIGDPADGDTLGDLACNSGQIPQYRAAGWQCSSLPIHRVTVLTYATGVRDTDDSNSWRKMTDVGTFMKHRDDSILKVHWTGHASVDDTGVANCVMQVRIDDNNRLNNEPASTVTGAAAIIGDTETAVPFHTMEIFEWPNAGNHDVSIHVRGTVDECFLNPGNYQHTVIIEEIG